MLTVMLIILHGVGMSAHAALGTAAAIASAALVAAISIFSGRMAGRHSNDAWFVIPALLFSTVPLAARLWMLASAEQTWWAGLVDFAPFVIGFAAPVLLLLTAYLRLGRGEIVIRSAHQAA